MKPQSNHFLEHITNFSQKGIVFIKNNLVQLDAVSYIASEEEDDTFFEW